MRIFHVSDLHIGMRLYDYDLRREQEYVLGEMIKKAQEYRPDVFLIAGDIYDKAVPSAEAVHVFNTFLSGLVKACPDMAVLMISGNHDSAERIDCFRSILAKQNVYMVGQPPRTKEEKLECVSFQDEYGEVRFYLMPFVKPAMVRQVFDEEISSYDETVRKMLEREQIDTSLRNVLVSHQYYQNVGQEAQRMASEVVTVGNIDSVSASCLKVFDYVALGHLHKPMKVGEDRIRYCGTPMAYSLDECNQQKGILMVTLTQKESPAEIEVLPLESLRNIKKVRGTLDEVLMSACDDFVSVTLTDKCDFDTLAMQEQLREAFPYLLEIKREHALTVNYEEFTRIEQKNESPFEMFCHFMSEMTDEEKELLKDVVNTVKDRGEEKE